jgi:NitT/TauT family transport system permease protein
VAGRKAGASDSSLARSRLLPVAVFLFGIGNGPAIFMVFIAMFLTMTLATITQIDSVDRDYINVARTMGTSKRQIYLR